jgi:TRAP-type C4-dicarboxylate transport system permease small subunit
MKRWPLDLAGSLVIALAALLFGQWPLRDWIQAYSRQANDIGQILFALYAAFAISAATRSNSHLALTKPAQSAIKLIPMWRNLGVAVCVVPWAAFLLWTALPSMWASVASREAFSEGLTQGYFMIRIALVLLAALVLLDAVAPLLRRWCTSQHP